MVWVAVRLGVVDEPPAMQEVNDPTTYPVLVADDVAHPYHVLVSQGPYFAPYGVQTAFGYLDPLDTFPTVPDVNSRGVLALPRHVTGDILLAVVLGVGKEVGQLAVVVQPSRRVVVLEVAVEQALLLHLGKLLKLFPVSLIDKRVVVYLGYYERAVRGKIASDVRFVETSVNVTLIRVEGFENFLLNPVLVVLAATDARR